MIGVTDQYELGLSRGSIAPLLLIL